MFKNKLNTRIITGSLDSIPWEEAYKLYASATEEAVRNYIASVNEKWQAKYDAEARRRALLEESLNPEGGSFEGDLNLDIEKPVITDHELRQVRLKAGDDALGEFFIKPYQLKSFGMRVMDEILAMYKSHKLNKAGPEGTICGRQYLLDNFRPTDTRALGIYRFLQYNQRSNWLSGAATKDGKRYCNLIPLILYAHKLYNNVPYNRWSRDTLYFVVNTQLADAMLTPYPEISLERRMELRDIGLTAKGEKRSATTTYMLYGLNSTEVASLNGLSRAMFFQTWCAHPSNRTKYMVLDPTDWDSMPTPLIGSNVFTSNLDSAPPPIHLGEDAWMY